MDRAEQRFRAAMIEPRSGGLCRYCKHDFDNRHVGVWCADCELNGDRCGAQKRLEARHQERLNERVTR